MRVAVNGKAFATDQQSGSVRAAVDMVRHVGLENADFQITVYIPAATHQTTTPTDLPANVRLRISRGPFLHTPGGRAAWEQLALARLARREGNQVLFSPTNSGPVLGRLGMPHVLVVHDAGAFNQAWFMASFARYMRWLVNRAARQGVRLVSVSHASAAEIAQAVPGSGEIAVVYNDSDPPPDDLDHEQSRGPFVLFLSSINPRKNLDGACGGFALLPEAGFDQVRLLVAGASKRVFQADDDWRASKRVEALGYVSEREKWQLLKEARCLLMPSHQEGFGIPVLEALKVGTPAVVADLPVFHELFDDAVEYVDPKSAEDIARGLGRVLGNPAYRRQLIERGYEVARRFSWAKAGRAYGAILREACQ